MLNVLLSFAQFEREVTGERIRDKIAAAKRKGMWMGGVPSIGYDVVNRQLVINEAEAAVVRRIFEEMLTIGSPTQIAANLTAEGITTKAWTTQEGQTRSGTRIDKKYLHKLLRNRIYLGELSHKGNWYPGAHPPIIERDLSIQPADQGMHIVVWLPHGLNDVAIASTASKAGIALRALSPMCSENRQLSGLMLGFGGFTGPQLMDAVKGLRRVLEASAQHSINGC